MVFSQLGPNEKGAFFELLDELSNTLSLDHLDLSDGSLKDISLLDPNYSRTLLRA